MSLNEEQKPPEKGAARATWDLVIDDMKERDSFGESKYGVRHQHDNGRDHLADAYQEALDLAVYLRAEIEKRKVGARLAARRRGGDMGLSSNCIADVMIIGMGTGDYPLDGADFGRCYRLLQVFPEWRKRMPEVAKAHPGVWEHLVEAWDALTVFHEKRDHDAVYDGIKQCERKARAR
jgi:hypothetical protein